MKCGMRGGIACMHAVQSWDPGCHLFIILGQVQYLGNNTMSKVLVDEPSTRQLRLESCQTQKWLLVFESATQEMHICF